MTSSFSLGGFPFGGDPVLLLVVLLLDAVLGRPATLLWLLPRRVPGVDGAMRNAVRRLDRPLRSPPDRSRRGLLAALLLTAAGGIAGEVLGRIAGGLPIGRIVEGWLLLWAVMQREPVAALRTIADGLDAPDGNPGPVRQALARLDVDPAAIDDRYGLARAAVESAMAQAVAGLCGTALAWLLFGMPGVGALLALRAGAAALRQVSATTPPFMAGYLLLVEIVLWVPGLLAGLLLAVGAVFAPQARPERALGAVIATAPGLHARIMPIAALAAAYDLALLGPRSAGPVLLPDGRWVGGGTARLESGHVRRAAALLTLAALLQFTLVLALIALRS